MAAFQYAATEPAIGSKDKSVGWYDKEFPGVNPDARDLLVNYANIEPGHVDQYAVQMVFLPLTFHGLPLCETLGLN